METDFVHPDDEVDQTISESNTAEVYDDQVRDVPCTRDDSVDPEPEKTRESAEVEEKRGNSRRESESTTYVITEDDIHEVRIS